MSYRYAKNQLILPSVRASNLVSNKKITSASFYRVCAIILDLGLFRSLRPLQLMALTFNLSILVSKGINIGEEGMQMTENWEGHRSHVNMLVTSACGHAASQLNV